MLMTSQQQGGDPDAILRAAGLTRFDINSEQGRLSAASHYRMLVLMQKYVGKIHEEIIYEDVSQLYEQYPELISFCLNQPSPRAAIKALLVYRAVIGNCDDIQVREGAIYTQYKYINQGPSSLEASQAISNFVIICQILRVYLPHLVVSVGFIGTQPLHFRQLDQFFGTHCRWEQGENSLAISNLMLDSPSDCYNKLLDQLQTTRLESMCANINVHISFESMVEELIRHNIRSGIMASDDNFLMEVCSAMNISRWTLNRKLQGEGCSFSTLLKKVRMMEACRLLGEGAQPLQDISGLVGFSSQSAFNRFFKTNANMTPLAYRNARQ